MVKSAFDRTAKKLSIARVEIALLLNVILQANLYSSILVEIPCNMPSYVTIGIPLT